MNKIKKKWLKIFLFEINPLSLGMPLRIRVGHRKVCDRVDSTEPRSEM